MACAIDEVLTINPDGDIECLYTDAIDLQDIGHICDMRRASHVEFDEESQMWHVICASDGKVIWRDKNRTKALAMERKLLR